MPGEKSWSRPEREGGREAGRQGLFGTGEGLGKEVL